MLSVKNVMIVGSVFLVAVILQAILVLVSLDINSPTKTAVNFTKAYFMLDGPAMEELLCSEMVDDETQNIVDEYLNTVANQARSMGFSQGYMKNQLSHIDTAIHLTDENNAKVRITGDRLRSINPVYAFIGRLFFLIETHKVDENLTLVKEEGNWKVCGKPFSLSGI